MTALRLIADDLTGALDAAAQFVGLGGAIHCLWGEAALAADPKTLPLRATLDASTREGSAETAAERAAAMAPALSGLAFRKLDSLLRGHEAVEIAATFKAGSLPHAIIAPAFPAQGRATRGGRQFFLRDGEWHDTGVDLAARLGALGIPVTLAKPGDKAPDGVSLWDAETEADLAAIVEAGRSLPGAVLWCGTAGLAGALAGSPPPKPDLPGPVLGLFGTDHPVTTAQLAAAGPALLRLPEHAADKPARITAHLERHGAAMVVADLPPGLPRAEAAARIEACLAAAIEGLPRPGTLVVAGGETLRGLADYLGAASLAVDGQLLPGVPTSRLVGGRWDGVRVVSKSGAFGAITLLRDLAAPTSSEAMP
ncbi:Hrp-dependent type III effector protein [Acetobacteraceae bacterium H6797]|nr:Hrp-dependent type III effector protein [Acetobacteraceae bacterium H6797]